MTTTETKTRTVTLTDAAPVKIRADQWPEIAGGEWSTHDNQYEFQANRTWKLWVKVRQHADGRTLVYGGYLYDTAVQNEDSCSAKRGELLGAGDDIIAAIRRVGSDLGAAHEDAGAHAREVVQECIADLPAQEI